MNTTLKNKQLARTSYTIEPDVLMRFNEIIPQGERSKIIEHLMRKALLERTHSLEKVADEFLTHPDFAIARADSTLWENATVADGLTA
jgi:hypothetical protein